MFSDFFTAWYPIILAFCAHPDNTSKELPQEVIKLAVFAQYLAISGNGAREAHGY